MRYEIHKSQRASGYYWILKADNGETVATSELYPSKSNAKRGAIDASGGSVDESHVVDKTHES